jgi:cytochrome c biogenesis protein CcmG, thiol:disulfide interchange protein DsbE
MPTTFRPTLVCTLVALFNCAGAMASEPSLDLAAYRGQVVVVDFWASWCKPCRASIPWLNQMRSRYGELGLVIIGVNVDAKRADADRFLRDVPAEFKLIFDSKGALAQQFGLRAMPSTYVYDRSGKLVRTHYGFRENRRQEHETALAALLSASAQ